LACLSNQSSATEPKSTSGNSARRRCAGWPVSHGLSLVSCRSETAMMGTFWLFAAFRLRIISLIACAVCKVRLSGDTRMSSTCKLKSCEKRTFPCQIYERGGTRHLLSAFILAKSALEQRLVLQCLCLPPSLIGQARITDAPVRCCVVLGFSMPDEPNVLHG
jgi:hypothetical protein